MLAHFRAFAEGARRPRPASESTEEVMRCVLGTAAAEAVHDGPHFADRRVVRSEGAEAFVGAERGVGAARAELAVSPKAQGDDGRARVDRAVEEIHAPLRIADPA